MIHGCRVTIVAAVADNGVIGAGGRLPWRLKSDLRRFRSLTVGKPVLMGRKTFESLDRPLPQRTNIVVGRVAAAALGVVVVPSVEAGLEAGARHAQQMAAPEIMVIGGGEIYRACLPLADRMCLTHVHASPDGDTLFPQFSLSEWRVVERQQLGAGAEDSAATTFTVYHRVTDAALL
ncbi:MAG: dihydrofolate reductase [Bauldia sp.]